MLAAAHRQDTPANDVKPDPSRARPPALVFTAAYAELCSRIWAELALLADAASPVDGSPAADLEMRAAILRLELVVLIDACRSARWRVRLLTADQCDRMCALLTDILAALYVDPDGLPAGIADSQDRVHAEFLAERAGAAARARAGTRCACGRPIQPDGESARPAPAASGSAGPVGTESSTRPQAWQTGGRRIRCKT